MAPVYVAAWTAVTHGAAAGAKRAVLTPDGRAVTLLFMNPTALMTKMAAKMTDADLQTARRATKAAIKNGGGSVLLQGTRWQNRAALEAEAARRGLK